MAPLTSPPGCGNCTFLAKKISELEQRISTLHMLREAELQMDTIVVRSTSPVPVSSSPVQTSPASGTGLAARPSHPETTTPPGPAGAGAAPARTHRPSPSLVGDSSWIRKGAKPKSFATSTPQNSSLKSHVTPGSTSFKQLLQATHHPVQLCNRFDILAQQDPPPQNVACQTPLQLPTQPTSVHRLSHPPSQRRLSIPNFTPAPVRSSTAPRIDPPAQIQSPSPKNKRSSPSHPPPLFPPTTALIGDSIVRNVRFFNAITHCFPGATVSVILNKLPGILRSLPSSVHRIIIHVGCVDAFKRQSEMTKAEFIKLLHYIKSIRKSVFISGPLPPYNRGSELFSRILSLHTWLKSVCMTHSVSFIDHFNLFWGRKSFFSDGLHLNKLGRHFFTANLQHVILNESRD